MVWKFEFCVHKKILDIYKHIHSDSAKK